MTTFAQAMKKELFRPVIIVLAIWLSISTLHAQPVADSLRMKKDVFYLASDKLQGRLTGTKYERKAGKYIAKELKKAGLKPYFPKGWSESFNFPSHFQESGKNQVTMNGKSIGQAIAGSGNGKIKGKLSRGEGAKEVKKGIWAPLLDGKLGEVYIVDLKYAESNPHSNISPWKQAVDSIRSLKPKLILLIHSTDDLSIKAMKAFTHTKQDNIMIVQVDEAGLPWHQDLTMDMEVEVNQKRPEMTAHNIVGYIDNGAKKTIVIGAHYDHLGHDEYANSLYRGKSDIHNGADDNASGTAMMLELARMTKANGSKDANYIFVAFSGEELGLLGSKVLAEKLNPKPMAMLNMDMVGRLNPHHQELGVFGTGTSSGWDSMLAKVKFEYTIKEKKDGLGASDHSSFYLNNIPALHFFSGFHPDYHKPSDDAEKLNYPGMTVIANYIYGISQQVAIRKTSMIFTPTSNESEDVPRFKVTLGIVPDYFYEGGGIKIDGISVGKSAEAAGLKKGDIIMKLGDLNVADMQGYMGALGKFEKGQTTTITFIRDGVEMHTPLTF